MAFEVTRIAFDTGTGAIGSTIVVTGAPSTPKAIILKIAGNVGAAAGVVSGNVRQCLGMAAERSAVITEGVSGSAIRDADASPNPHRWMRDDACLWVLDKDGIENGRVFLQSMDSNGFTLEVSQVFTQNYRVEVLMLGGTDLLEAEVQNWLLAGPGDFNITVYSFQPQCMLLASHWQANATLPDNRNIATFTFGACVASAEQGFVGHDDEIGATSQSFGACHEDSECLAKVRTSTPNNRVRFESFLSNGARFNATAGTDRIIALALRGGDYAIREMLTQTDTVTDIDVVSLPSKPSGGLVFSGYRTEDAIGAQQPDARESLGFWDGSGAQGVQSYFSENGLATSNVAIGQRGDAVYQSINTTPAQDGAMAFISAAATSAKFRMIDADPSVRFTFGLFFGPAPVAGTINSVDVVDCIDRIT